MRCDVRKTGAFSHDRPGTVNKVGKRQELGDLLYDRVRAFKGEPDARQQHHGPGEQVQDAAGEFFALKPRGHEQAEGDQADRANE